MWHVDWLAAISNKGAGFGLMACIFPPGFYSRGKEEKQRQTELYIYQESKNARIGGERHISVLDTKLSKTCRYAYYVPGYITLWLILLAVKVLLGSRKGRSKNDRFDTWNAKLSLGRKMECENCYSVFGWNTRYFTRNVIRGTIYAQMRGRFNPSKRETNKGSILL